MRTEKLGNMYENQTRLLRGRPLLILDYENIAGGPNFKADDREAARDAGLVYKLLVDICSLDHLSGQTIVGMSRYSLKRWMTSMPYSQVQLVVGDGPSGADRALIDAVDTNHVASRFDSVIIASGDHIFASLAKDLRVRGLQVCNVTSSRAQSSPKLAQECNFHVYLKVGRRAK